MDLSRHFTLEELVASETAARRGIDNTPSAEIVENLKVLCLTLEEVKDVAEGKAVLISSGYRCPKLNSAVGGSRNSAHMEGLAADCTSPKFGSVKQFCEAIRDSDIQFDQLIFEFDSWAHISINLSGQNRRQVITARKVNGKTEYSDGIV